MFKLTRIIKSLIGAALLNVTVRSALRNALIKSIDWITKPSTISSIYAFASRLMKSKPGSPRSKKFHTLFNGAVALAILRLTKRSKIGEATAISTICALLLNMIKSRESRDGYDRNGQRDQIIDVDQYTVVDE